MGAPGHVPRLAGASFQILFLTRSSRHTFPQRSGSVLLIAVASHALDVEETPRRAEAVSFTHRGGASI